MATSSPKKSTAVSSEASNGLNINGLQRLPASKEALFIIVRYRSCPHSRTVEKAEKCGKNRQLLENTEKVKKRQKRRQKGGKCNKGKQRGKSGKGVEYIRQVNGQVRQPSGSGKCDTSKLS